MKKRVLLNSFCLLLCCSIYLQAENIDDDLDGFDDAPVVKKVLSQKTDAILDGFDDKSDDETTKESNFKILEGLTGKITEQISYSYLEKKPLENLSSLKTSLLLDYEHKFSNDFKIKINAKAYYDAIYEIRGKQKYSDDVKSAFKDELELFDAYVQGKILDNLDFKVGRQVVVWGRSDTIRITDVINPIDNRRPGMVDIEDLRLPIAMAKFDYFIGNWRITPIAILEQRFSKRPPAGSTYNKSPFGMPSEEHYEGITPALSVGAEYSGWDVNLYAAQLRDDDGFLEKGKFRHHTKNMYGLAFNLLKGSWLLKSELAYFDGVKYSVAPNKKFQRTDALLGLEYNGIADTIFSYDVSLRSIYDYENILQNEFFEVEKNTYQQAFRVSSDFINATLHANYLISLFGKKLNKGGFQRAWIQYDISDSIYTNVGVVDYMGGSKRFDMVKNSDLIFADVTYGF